MTQTPWTRQIENRNFLSPVGFKFNLTKKPKIDFFCNSANIPGINMGVAMQPNYLRPLPVPGDILSYEDLTIRFNVDEDMVNYLEVYNWLVQYGFPFSRTQYQSLLTEDTINPGTQTAISGMSDASLLIYTSNYNPNIEVNFKDIFPVSLSTINFDTTLTDIRYVTAEATFKYTIYDIIKL